MNDTNNHYTTEAHHHLSLSFLFYSIGSCAYVRRLYMYRVGKGERTREVILEGMKDVQKAFAEHDLIANVRLETYDPDRYLHVPPPPASNSK